MTDSAATTLSKFDNNSMPPDKNTTTKRKQPFKHSLQWRLVVLLTLVILVFSTIVAGYSAWQSYIQAQKLQDLKLASLVSLAKSHDLTFKQDQVDVNFDYDEPNIITAFDTARFDNNAIDVSLFSNDELDNQTIIFWLTDHRLEQYFESSKIAALTSKPDGLYDITSHQEHWRVYLYTADPQNKDNNRLTTRLLVAEKSDIRQVLAWQSAKKIMLPLVLLIPLMVIVIVLTINQLFLPLRTVTEILQHSSNSPQALAKTYSSKDLSLLINDDLVNDLPSEIQPFLRLIQQQVNDLMAIMATNKRFIANASHQLRTPMTAVLLQAENLKNLSVDTPDYQHQVDELLASIKRNNQLMNQLLLLAKSEQFQTAQNISQYSVVEAISQILIDFYPVAEKKQITLGVEKLEEVMLPINEIGFKIIVQNLVENAIKYTPNGGLVEISLQQIFLQSDDNTDGCIKNDNFKHDACQTVILKVSDTGQGIAKTEISKVLEPFYQVHDQVYENAKVTFNHHAFQDVTATGFGLGLSIVSNLVANSGGQFQLQNRYAQDIDAFIGLDAIIRWQLEK